MARSARGALLLGLVILGSRPTIAALRELSFEDLTRESRHIVTAKVLSLRSYESAFEGQAFAGGDRCLFTDVRLRVQSVLKGNLVQDAEITVQMLGGQIGEAWVRCLESETYRKGEQVLLFLREVNGKLRATGWLQGKYTLRVEGGVPFVVGKAGLPIATTLTLEAVRQQVTLFSASGTSAESGAGASLRKAAAEAEDRTIRLRRVSEKGSR